MPQDHYQVLGVDRTATEAQVKSAYRTLARQLHPDVNPAPDAKEQFQKIQLAYEVLSDRRRRAAYDGLTAPKRPSPEEKSRQEAEDLRRRADERMADGPGPPKIDNAETSRLVSVLKSGRVTEAESLARAMLAREFRQPVPHAILGDIAKLRGEFGAALKSYGYAAQFEPTNTVYQRRYEELLSNPDQPAGQRGGQLPEIKAQPLAVCVFLIVVCAVYTALAPEKPLGLPLVTTWSLGTVSMLLLAGLVLGSCLQLSGALASFALSKGGALIRVHPAIGLCAAGLVSFWLAAVAYLVVGQTQRTFSRSLSVLVGSTIGSIALFALAALARGPDSALQTLVWGGNLLLVAAVAGWSVTDAVLRSSRPENRT